MPPSRNLLIILAGGLRTDVFSHIGDWPVNTPHLDAIARRGLSAAAVCASPANQPAMVSCFTGLSPRQHGVTDDTPAIRRVGGWVKQLVDAGYHTAGAGRVGLIAEHLKESCVVADVGTLDIPSCAYLTRMEHRGMFDRVQRQRQQRNRSGSLELEIASTLMSGDDVDGFIAQQARLILERLPRDKPWAMIVAFTGPGNDLPAPMQYLAPIDPKPLGEKFIPVDLTSMDRYAQTSQPRSMLQRLRPGRIAQIRRHYLARVMMLDHHVGILKDLIDRQGQTSKTWLAFSADHGWQFGERGLVGHRCFLNGTVYVPMWFLPPEGLEEHSLLVNQHLVTTADFAATICALGGIDAPRGCLGQSILPAMSGREVGGDTALSEFGDRLMLETMQHRVVFNIESGRMLSLFDLVKDPNELKDLQNDPVAMNLGDMLRWHLAQTLLPLRPIMAA